MLRILFCSNPLAPAEPEPDFIAEAAMAARLGLPVSLIDHDSVERDYDARRGLRRLGPIDPGPVLYRGWMLRVEAYDLLFRALAERGLHLVTTPDRYALAHHWPEAYSYLAQWAARTLWIEEQALTEADILARLAAFGRRSVVIKDWVKSQASAYWDTACFIPDASDGQAGLRIVRRFLDLQGASLTGGLVLRDFIALNKVGGQTEEWRAFVVDGSVCACNRRFIGAGEAPPADLTDKVARSLPSRFFSADFARRIDGGWSLVEVGDGQVSALPPKIGPEQLYAALACAFGEP